MRIRHPAEMSDRDLAHNISEGWRLDRELGLPVQVFDYMMHLELEAARRRSRWTAPREDAA